MMHRQLSILLIGTTAALVVWFYQPSQADPPATPKKTDPAPQGQATDWKDDPVCQMVFFAVLEGLYSDGVPDAVVDSIVPRKSRNGDNPVKTSFVVQCPLCHPVYEAFSLYQQRQAFNGDAKKRNTFGKGIAPDLERALKSPETQTRLVALRQLVQRWVERRLTTMRLTEEEKREWTTKLAERSEQGKGSLGSLMRDDPNYKGWSLYWGCAACNGTTDACRSLNSGKK